MSPDASKMWIRMAQQSIPAILELRHTPAVLIKTEVASRPASPGIYRFFFFQNFILSYYYLDDSLVHLRKAPPTRRLLKKEISLDSYTWLKRYGSKSSGGQSAQPSVAHHHHHQQATVQTQHSVSSVESLMKLSRRNSFCNVPESGET